MHCRYHQEVSACLEEMLIPHALEFASPDGLISVDIVTRCGDGSPLAIEVDGPLHFSARTPHRPLGHTVLRNNMISALGFKYCSVPFYEWDRLHPSNEKATYMARKLQQFGLLEEEEEILDL